MSGDNNDPLDGFLESVEEEEGDGLGEIEDRIDEMTEDEEEITLKKGNFEELTILMLQDIKIDLLKIQKYLAEKGDFEIEDN